MDLLIVMAAVVSLIVLANVTLKLNQPTLSTIFPFILAAFNVPVLFMGILLMFASPEVLSAAGIAINIESLDSLGLWFVIMAIWGTLVALPGVRRLVALLIPLQPDNPVHATALLLSGYLVGNTLSTLSQGGLEGLVTSIQSVTVWETIASQLLFVMVALTGVGLFVRRDGRELLERLGLTRPTLKQLFFGVLIAIALFLGQLFAGLLATVLNPGQIDSIESINEVMLGDFDTVWEWFLLAAAAGIGEELLFRGAIQPAFGLPFASILFTIGHIQYGFSVVSIFVLILAVALGLVRRYMNTTIAVFVHFTYNFILGMLALLAPYLEQLANQLS